VNLAPVPSQRATRPAVSKDAADPSEKRALATRTSTFDFQAKVDAEAEREREVLEQLMLAQLKFEDEIVKKWIELI
jgi:hypothetical protein